jgi:single-stranded DNA-binding protein
MNKVILSGNVGNVKVAEKYIDFSLAVKGWNKETTWFNCKIFYDKQKEIFTQYVGVGSKLLVEGSIQINEYNDKKYTNIVVSSFEMLGGKKEDEQGQPQQQTGGFVIDDNDLPF